MTIEFKKPSITEAYSLIQKELKDIPFESLDISPRNGIVVNPIYNTSPTTTQLYFPLEYRIIFQYFPIDKTDIKASNKRLITSLENGQNGLLLDFKRNDWNLNELEILFENIHLDYIHTEFFETNESTKINLENYISTHYAELTWEHCFFNEQVHCLSDKNFVSSAADFIQNYKEEKAFVFIELSGDYFWDISKIRAFKTLLYQHLKLDNQKYHIIIVGETTRENKSTDKLENNILKLTTEAMSAMIGGCDGLWIRPFNENYDEAFSSRISRNIFHLMQEESYMHLVNDVSSGSYFIENYTEQIARQIYAEFKTLNS